MKQGLGAQSGSQFPGIASDARAEINMRPWDEVSEQDFSNWRALWHRAKESPKLSPDSYRACIGASSLREPLLIWLSAEGDWRGAAVLGVHPFFARVVGGRHLTTPFGRGEIVGLAPVVEPGFERPFAESFLAWLHALPRQPLAVDLRLLSKDSAMTAALLSQDAKAVDVSTKTELTVPYRQLDAHWSPWTQGSRNLRQQLKRRALQLNNGRWRTECTDKADSPDEFDEAFERFVEIEGAGWKRGVGALAQDSDSLRYFQLLSTDSTDIGMRIYSLWVEGTVAAANIVLYAHDRFLLSRQAYREAYRSYSPGMLLMAETIEAISRECPHAIIDFDGERTPFSQRWLDKGDERIRISLYARTPAGRAYRSFCEVRAAMRLRLRAVRQKLRVMRRKLGKSLRRSNNDDTYDTYDTYVPTDPSID